MVEDEEAGHESENDEGNLHDGIVLGDEVGEQVKVPGTHLLSWTLNWCSDEEARKGSFRLDAAVCRFHSGWLH